MLEHDWQRLEEYPENLDEIEAEDERTAILEQFRNL